MKTQSTWPEFIQSLTSIFTLHPPAKGNEVQEAETSLGVLFPKELKDLLQASNGIDGPYGLGLIWNANRIQKDNLRFRQLPEFKELYMPFEHLLFFADAGNGDQFAFGILNGKVRNRDVFVWNHENDSREWVAPSLDVYLEWWLNGKLKV